MTTRRNITLDDDLYANIVRATAREQAETGKPTSVSEWIREACRQRLERETR